LSVAWNYLVYLSAPAANTLRIIGAGEKNEPAPMPILTEAGVIPERQRPGTRQAHIAFEHIEPLGQFIDAGLPQEPDDDPLMDAQSDAVRSLLIESIERQIL
jgi:hypothetical protein